MRDIPQFTLKCDGRPGKVFEAPLLARLDVLRPVSRRDVARVFAEELRHARFDVGLNQEDLAHWAGWDRTYSSLLERGLRTPSLMQLLNLAPPLSLRPGSLVDRTASRLSRVPSIIHSRFAPNTLTRISVNAERLRVLRGFTEDQFAARTGLESADLRQLALGECDLAVTRLDRMAHGLNCDVIDLMSAS